MQKRKQKFNEQVIECRERISKLLKLYQTKEIRYTNLIQVK